MYINGVLTGYLVCKYIMPMAANLSKRKNLSQKMLHQAMAMQYFIWLYLKAGSAPYAMAV